MYWVLSTYVLSQNTRHTIMDNIYRFYYVYLYCNVLFSSFIGLHYKMSSYGFTCNTYIPVHWHSLHHSVEIDQLGTVRKWKLCHNWTMTYIHTLVLHIHNTHYSHTGIHNTMCTQIHCLCIHTYIHTYMLKYYLLMGI